MFHKLPLLWASFKYLPFEFKPEIESLPMKFYGQNIWHQNGVDHQRQNQSCLNFKWIVSRNNRQEKRSNSSGKIRCEFKMSRQSKRKSILKCVKFRLIDWIFDELECDRNVNIPQHYDLPWFYRVLTTFPTPQQIVKNTKSCRPPHFKSNVSRCLHNQSNKMDGGKSATLKWNY